MLGASVLLHYAPVAPAQDAPSGGQRPATERWQRIKSQYDVKTTPVSRTPQVEPAVKATTDAAPGSTSLRSVYDEIPSNFKPVPSAEQVPVRTAAVPAAAAPAAAAVPVEAEPDWVLPEPMTAEAVAELTAEEILSRPEEEVKVPAPADAKPYEEPVRTPDTNVVPNRGTPRSLQRPAPGDTPRKTTQVRRMSDIAPLNDFDRDTDIKHYAEEKAREFNVRFGGEQYAPRNFPDVAMCWAPPDTKYYPLYFQDPALERYGHTHHHLLQPVISSARFSGQLVMMPYQMTIDPPWDLQSPLGWYRPGDVVPKLRYPFPWNTKAAAMQAAAVTGFIYVIP